MFRGSQSDVQSQTAGDMAGGKGKRCGAPRCIVRRSAGRHAQRYSRSTERRTGSRRYEAKLSKIKVFYFDTSVQFCCIKIKQASWGLPRAFNPQLALLTRKSSLLSGREAVFSVPVGGNCLFQSDFGLSNVPVYTSSFTGPSQKLPLLCTPRRLEKEPPGILWGGDCSAFCRSDDCFMQTACQ